MSAEDQLYQQIENYLKGNLSADEKTAFEHRLSIDPELKNKLALSKLANELVIENRLLNVKQALQDVHNNSGKSNTWRNILLGTTGLLLLGGTALFILNNKEENNSIKNNAKPVVENISQPAAATETDNSSGTIINKGSARVAKQATTINPSPSENTITEEARKTTIDSVVTKPIQNNIIPAKPEPEVKESAAATPVQPAAVVSPCASVHIKSRTTTVNPCEGEENGSITISGIKDGNAPYKIQLNDNTGNELYSYHNLRAGKYSATITDSKGCTEQVTSIVLSDKKCSKDYAFNPFTGELWHIPVSETPGTLIIHDKAGDLCLQKELSAGTQETWDGYSQQGELKAGYYIYTISYKNGTIVNGSISIVK